ncbi:hypothetical protein GCM10028784_37050 [Myceligenerans cantabricum]
MHHERPVTSPPSGVGTADLVDALTLLGRTQRVAAERTARDLGWPRAGLGVLRMLGCSGAAPLSDVAAALQVDLSVASRHVGALADAGYVVRAVDEDDRRVRTVEITDAGRALVERTNEQFAQLAERMFGTWSEDDVAAAVIQLRHLTDAIGATHDIDPHQNVSRI